MKFYAVRVGRKNGIFYTWDECKAQVNGYKGAVYKSFSSMDDALSFINESSVSTSIPPDTTGYTVVYTDGACSGNGGSNARGGIGVFFGDNDPRNVSERFDRGIATNQRAEWLSLEHYRYAKVI
jgi:ribonuclease HI